MRLILRRIGYLCFMLVVMLVCAVFQPVKAYATGLTAMAQHDRVARGESLMINSLDPCPYVQDTSTGQVRAEFRDSTETLIGSHPDDPNYGIEQEIHNVGSYLYNGGGQWGTGIITIPASSALGVATITLECTLWADNPDGFVVVETYDPIYVIVLESTDEVVVYQNVLGQEATFVSDTPCIAESDVSIEVHSQYWLGGTSGMQFGSEVTDVIHSDSEGNWTYTVKLGQEGVNLGVGDSYSFRATCTEPEVYSAYDPFISTPAYYPYVALGDSYSSGEGSFNYDVDASSCHRSSDSYSYYVASHLNYGTPWLKACSGAVTDDVFNDGPVAAAQASYVSEYTQFVTLTFGGNDMGFGEILEACAQSVQNSNGWGCSSNSYYENVVVDRLNGLKGVDYDAVPPVYQYIDGKKIHPIREVIQEVAAAAPYAAIYIAGYPKLFGTRMEDFEPSMSAPGGTMCNVGPGLIGVSYSWDDAQWMNEQAELLNEAIADAAEVAYENDGINVTYIGPSFFGHSHCDSSSSWFNGVLLDGNLNPEIESFHPTTTGMREGYGTIFASVMPEIPVGGGGDED